MQLAISYEGGAVAEAVVLSADIVEVTPDTLCRPIGTKLVLDTQALAVLQDLNRSRPVLLHGVNLSIGSSDEWNQAYIGLLEECFAALPNVLWHSEHLGFTRVLGQELCTMLPVPYTQEALDLVSRRVDLLHARFDVPFLLEPVVNLLPSPPAEMTEAAFLNRLAERTGCGILLDAYNLECDRRNHGRNVAALLEELDLHRVHELHVAGGVAVGGVQLDVHTSAPDSGTLALVADICARASNLRVVTFELLREGFDVLGTDGAMAALRDLRTLVEQARVA